MTQTKIVEQAESIIELLLSQCADLELLLVLAKRETVAAEKGDFEELLGIVVERVAVEQKLDSFQRQVETLRDNLGYKFDVVLKHSIVERAALLIGQIRAQDEVTRPLLVSSRNEALEKLQQTNRSQKSISAYANEQSKSSVACDTLF